MVRADLRLGNNIMRLFSFLYIAASNTERLHYFSCIYVLLGVI